MSFHLRCFGHLLKLLRRHLRVTSRFLGNAFFVRQPDPATRALSVRATLLFLAPCLIIVCTGNVFAILGLRALYFALAAMNHRFKTLEYALAPVPVFIGMKILLVGIVG